MLSPVSELRPMTEPKVVLIGGASHTGKSTIAAALSKQLGWPLLSTDSLGRHPGRPWSHTERPVPKHVVSYYLDLGADAIFESVLQHYDNMWVTVRRIIERRTSADIAVPLIIEGSALLPEAIATLSNPTVQPVWLTANSETLRQRVLESSRYDSRMPQEKHLIESFVTRNSRLNMHVRTHAEEFGDRPITATANTSINDLVVQVGRLVT